ncbi:MAG: hypothetical protein ACRDFX_08325 [Chloroflexota bacterium]
MTLQQLRGTQNERGGRDYPMEKMATPSMTRRNTGEYAAVCEGKNRLAVPAMRHFPHCCHDDDDGDECLGMALRPISRRQQQGGEQGRRPVIAR